MFLCFVCEFALCLVSVALAFAVFLVRILDCDFFASKELTVHVCDGFIGGVEVGEGYESVAFGEIVVVACDLERS